MSDASAWRSGPATSRAAAVVFALVVGAACRRPAPVADGPLHVAAAADLSQAFPAIGEGFAKATGRQVTFSFGASGLLAQQIAQGAPFDVFAAANVGFVDDVVAAGACDESTKATYAVGRLVLWTRADTPFVPTSIADLARPEVVHLAIANPEHAPYGKAAREALQKSAVWDAVAAKVVYGENVQQALQFAQSGNAEVAIVALSLASGSGGHATPVDPALYAPLTQALVVCRGAPEAQGQLTPDARRFAAYVVSEEGRAVLARYGFAR